MGNKVPAGLSPDFTATNEEICLLALLISNAVNSADMTGNSKEMLANE